MKKGKYKLCGTCGKQIYVFPNRLKPKNFCSPKCRSLDKDNIKKFVEIMKNCERKYVGSPGHKMSDKHKKILSERMKQHNPMKNKSSIIKMQETKKKKYPNGIKQQHSKERRRKASIYMKNGGAVKARKANANSITSIEKKMMVILNDLGLDYEYNKIIDNHAVDFFIRQYNLIIECDGDYWHNYPIGLPKDKEQTKNYKGNGYKILRFWEREINGNQLSIINSIEGVC